MKYKILLKLNHFVFALFSFSGIAIAQNVLVSGASVGNGTYSDLGSAFTAINGGAQTGATIIVAITGNTIESATASLNAGAWSNLTIVPTGGTTRVITANLAGPTISFNGASRVLIDGLNTGGNALSIENTNTTTASTIQFINDARLIAVNKVALFGANTSATSGTVFFSTGLVSGNDSIGFNECLIRTSGANFPVNGVASIGSPTAGLENSNITFNNCNIENFFSPTLISVGIFAGIGNTDWTINNCRFYQTGTRTYTTANTHRVIQIASGNNHSITNNTIGFASASGTGVYTMAGTIATRFIGIDVAAGTSVASSIQGNSISSITLATSSGATTTNGVLCGINITSGNVNIGNIAGNIIGSTTGTNSLVVTSTTSGAIIMGINTSSTGAIAIQNNSIGALASSGITATVAGSITGINVSGVAASLTISNNTIGNSTTDNMRGGTSGLTTGTSIVHGINAPSTATNPTISNNIIQNLAAYGTGTSGAVRGINTAATTGNINAYTIQNNTIQNLVTNAANSSISNAQPVVSGISISTGTNGIVRGNTIRNLSNSGTGTNQSYVVGIGHGNATNTSIIGNTIFNLSNAGTSASGNTPSAIVGVVVRSGTTAVNIANNMISLGNAQSTNTVIIGIQCNNGSTPDPISNIYHNTINIEGTASTGAQPSFGIARTDFSATARTAGIDIRNNIITNSRSGGTGAHYAICNNYGAVASSATGWSSNNNVLNASAATIGFWNGTSQTLAAWKTIASSDANSYSGITVTYVNSANDLHLNMGLTPTVIESSGQSIAAVTTDIDGQNRPGPTGSVNGGAFAPDLGADEFDGVYLDLAAPNISYTPLSFICATGDRTLSAVIIDGSGVPTSGPFQPRIYFNKNSGAWLSSQGTLVSGTATNGTWNFTISAAALGGLSIGDNVGYYVIAQDIAAPNIGSNPSIGLVASNVNVVTTPPTSPNIYSISTTLSGNYNVGTTGVYPTLTAAANAYNTSCLNGGVTFTLIDATYPSEVFPIVFNSNPDASAVNGLVIVPAIGVSPVISGSSVTSIIQINGGDYITINGNNNNSMNTICPLNRSTRDLKIENTNSAPASAVIAITNTASGNAATHNRIINTIVSGNAPLTTGIGINISGPAIGSGAGAVNNSDIAIVNDSIIKVQVGIFSGGASITTKNSKHSYDLNVMTAKGTNSVGRFGIMSLFADSVNIRSNSIGNIVNSTSQDAVAIALGLNAISNSVTAGSEVSNAVVTGNTIDSIVQTNTFSAGGIVIAAANTGTHLIANNYVNRVFANGTAGDFGVGILLGGGTGTLNVYHNSVNVSGAALTGASQPNTAIGINGTAPNVNIKNNILLCSGSNGFNGNTGIALGYTSTVGAYANLNSSNNDIFVSGASSVIGRTGGLAAGTVRTTLLDWQTETGADLNSVSLNPTFISPSNLGLIAGSNAGIENAGTPLAAVTNDINCEARSNTPDIGADEVCFAPTLATISASASSICVGDSVTLSVSAGSLNDATIWQWYSASCGGTAVGTGTSITIAPNDTTDYFVRAEGGCVVAGACSNITIIVKPLPTISGIPIGVDVCSGQTLTLNATGDAASYTWNNGVANNVAFTPTATTTYTVTATAANGCSKVDSTIVTFNLSPSVSASANDSTLCAGQSVTLNGGGAISYAWNNSVVDGVSFIPTTTGTYIVTGTAANSCTDTASITITVNPNPVVNLGGNQSTCNATLILDAGNVGNAYLWNNGLTTQTISVTSSGTYSVVVTSVNGCSDSDTSIVTLNSVLVANLTPNISSVCEGSATISLVGSPAGGTFSSNAPGGLFNPTTAGTFAATYIVSNVCGTDTADATITVNANPVASLTAPVSAPCAGTPVTLTGLPAGGTYSVVSGNPGALVGNVFNALSTGSYSVSYSTTNASNCTDTAQFTFTVNCVLGLDNTTINNLSLTIYPNPNNGQFVITSNLEINGSVELINELGQVVYKALMNGLTQSVNVQGLSAGIYHLKLSDGNFVQTKRISVAK